MSPVVIAVDGPAGSGKSSVSRALAARLGYRYLDTGAAYRAVAWEAADLGVDLDDAAAIVELVRNARAEQALDPAERWVRVGEADVTAAIREPRVSAIVSRVAGVQAARDALNERFRALIAGSEPGIVVEGRDITTVVAPDAEVRVLLTAAPEVRAARRALELAGAGAAGGAAEHAEVLRAITERDEKDSRMVEFLSAAPGVTTVDSTELSFDETVDAIERLVPGR